MTGTLEKHTRSVEGTDQLGAAFAPALQLGDVVALRGPLGAGKTRFVSGMARGMSPGARVRSPSFTLVNEYLGVLPLFHLDLYRLEVTRDVEGLGLEEYAERGALVVEWGERLPVAWLAEALMIAIEPAEGDARVLRASAFGGRGKVLLEAWRTLPESA
ncbi:MAG: tRNA (adenosine(37)-N6)-threonylcarbamoyltransferase complex ATPase subunit type 1 TsaE [Candidatus Eisenbacteria bacterium]